MVMALSGPGYTFLAGNGKSNAGLGSTRVYGVGFGIQDLAFGVWKCKGCEFRSGSALGASGFQS